MIDENDLFKENLDYNNVNLNNVDLTNINDESIKTVSETCGCIIDSKDFFHPLKMYIRDEYGEKIVRSTTSFLPMADSVGHKILAANDVIITSILNDKHLDYSFKKKIILTIIDISRQGDDMGSVILKGYHDLVDCLL
jgi:hypothetical protein